MKTIFTLCFGLFVASIFAQDCDNRYQTKDFPNVSVSTVKYGEAINRDGNNQELYMDIYTPDGDNFNERPLVLFAFGGSFVAGSRDSEELVYFATELAKRGYVCASIDYRLGNFLDLISLEGAVKTVFRAVQDGKAAVRFFRKSVEEEGNPYGINPATIYTGGTSAGGILSIHLAYVDDVQKLPLEWQTWLNEVGGLEGNSGNPGYCSKSNGVFSFSGAIADTVWLESNDVPIYSVHSTEDDIVPYGFGRPLGGNAPIDLYGSGLITPRMQNLQVPVELDRYEDSFHPSFQTDNQMETQRRVDSTERRLVDFLYSLLPCNTNNVLQAGVEQCETFGSSINELGAVEAFIIYPNPAETELIIERRVPGIRSYRILDFTGKEVQKGVLIETKMKIQLDQLQSGTYLLQIDGLGAKKLLLQ